MVVQKKWLEIPTKKEQQEYVIQEQGHTKKILGRYSQVNDTYEWEVFDLYSNNLDPVKSDEAKSAKEAIEKVEEYWESVEF